MNSHSHFEPMPAAFLSSSGPSTLPLVGDTGGSIDKNSHLCEHAHTAQYSTTAFPPTLAAPLAVVAQQQQQQQHPQHPPHPQHPQLSGAFTSSPATSSERSLNRQSSQDPQSAQPPPPLQHNQHLPQQLSPIDPFQQQQPQQLHLQQQHFEQQQQQQQQSDRMQQDSLRLEQQRLLLQQRQHQAQLQVQQLQLKQRQRQIENQQQQQLPSQKQFSQLVHSRDPPIAERGLFLQTSASSSSSPPPATSALLLAPPSSSSSFLPNASPSPFFPPVNNNNNHHFVGASISSTPNQPSSVFSSSSGLNTLQSLHPLHPLLIPTLSTGQAHNSEPSSSMGVLTLPQTSFHPHNPFLTRSLAHPLQQLQQHEQQEQQEQQQQLLLQQQHQLQQQQQQVHNLHQQSLQLQLHLQQQRQSLEKMQHEQSLSNADQILDQLGLQQQQQWPHQQKQQEDALSPLYLGFEQTHSTGHLSHPALSSAPSPSDSSSSSSSSTSGRADTLLDTVVSSSTSASSFQTFDNCSLTKNLSNQGNGINVSFVPSSSTWVKADGLLSHRTLLNIPRLKETAKAQDDASRRLSHASTTSSSDRLATTTVIDHSTPSSSAYSPLMPSIIAPGADFTSAATATMLAIDENEDMSVYSLNARVIQKKDQLEELSETGTIIPAPVVEEVRTGQQFLIKLHLVKTRPTPSSAFPSLRVGRREAINTAGESRTDPEPLTLEVFVHLAKSGQIRQGACAKCCHKYGPASPILVLLDPLSPSVTDPLNYAHVDTTSGSITLLAKVVCSSTDHGERGNKERYSFEFRLKRTSTMPLTTLVAVDTMEDVGESIAACFTPPIMCSGHHKAKRTYPHQRPSKTSKGAPTPKVKTIKRHKSAPHIMHEPYGGDSQPHASSSSTSSSTLNRNPDHHSGLSFLPEHLSQGAMVDPYRSRSNEATLNSAETEDFLLTPAQSSTHPLQQPPQAQYPRVLEVRPDHGPIRKTTDVVLRGLFFQEGMVPYFGCFPAQDIVIETNQLIICRAPESPLPGTVGISIYDNMGNNYSNLGQFTYTDDSETELLILQLQLRLAHRALEYLHAQATGQKGNAVDILRDIPGLAASSPRTGGALMMEAMYDSGGEGVSIMSLSQVEEGILSTLDQLPREIDISLQLEDGSNLLHLSILLGFNTLTRRLIEDGCDIEATDAWSMTPLRYAVLKGNEAMARELVLAGASSSGAKTPQEFYSQLPYSAPYTPAMVAFLTLCCQRFSQTGSPWVSDADSDALMEEDEGEGEESSNNIIDSAIVCTTSSGSKETNSESDQAISTLTDAIQRVRVSRDIPPLDQQDLPPLQTIQDDGSIKINSKVIKGSDLPTPNDPSSLANVNPESGYLSGVYSEVQERLERSHIATLPSKGIEFGVTFKRPLENSVTPTRPMSVTAMPMELFRTGDSFSIEIKITVDPLLQSGQGYPGLPKEFVGLRLPHEMVKRTNGRPASILTDMTYGLNVSIELGQESSLRELGHESHGDGILLNGSCQACSKFLHEHRKLSPSRRPTVDPSVYPILQFNVPGGSSSSTAAQTGAGQRNNSGVVELRDGRCELKARVNCSSLHHLVHRERDRRAAELKRRKAAQGTDATGSLSSLPSVSPPLMALADLEDPGFVFKFELVHPTTREIVASHSTHPTLFQSYPRGRA